MKLNNASIKRTLDQIEGQVIPEDHPAAAQLHLIYGDHTFFLGAAGLKIVEPVEEMDDGTRKAQVIKLAQWKDPNYNSLVPHQPQITDEVVVLEDAE